MNLLRVRLLIEQLSELEIANNEQVTVAVGEMMVTVHCATNSATRGLVCLTNL